MSEITDLSAVELRDAIASGDLSAVEATNAYLAAIEKQEPRIAAFNEVLAEAALSYLGLGPPPPNASWDRLLQEAQVTVLVAPVGAVAPGVLLVLLVVGVNLVADGFRDLADPTRRRSR